MTDSSNIIAFQGVLGAYSHMACQAVKPEMEVLPCRSFEDMILAVQEGRAELAMVPVENSIAGRVADIHHLLPGSGLYINGEHFQRVRHNLLAPRGAKIEDLQVVHSHTQALAQCRRTLRDLKLKTQVHADTAGAAADVAALDDPTQAAIASSLAAEIYGLDVLRADIEDEAHNTTRFVMLSREPDDPELGDGAILTTFVFRVRNVPAALYKALGGFATNGINMLKLESYMLGGAFNATQFYADVEGHPEDPAMQRAFEELGFFSREVRVLGVYPASPFRENNTPQIGGS